MNILFKSTNSKLIEIKLYINAGAIYDSTPGVAHFVEHLILSRENIKIKNLESNNIFLNGATSQDGIMISCKVLKEELVKTLSKLKDVVFNAKFSKKNIEFERKIILSEINDQNFNHDQKMFIDFLKDISGINLHNELGGKNYVEKINTRTLNSFYKNFIREGNSALFVKGKLSNAEKQTIKAMLSKKTCPATLLKMHYTKCNKICDAKGANSSIFILLNNDGLFNINKLKFELFGIAYFSSLSPLFKDIRDDKNFCYYADFDSLFFQSSGFLALQIDTKKQFINKIMHAINEKLLIAIDEKLFNNAKKCLIKRLYEDYDDDINIEARLKRLIYNQNISLTRQEQYIKSITYKDFIAWSNKLIKSGFSSLILKNS